jgi:predicted RNA methylase
MNKVLKTYAKLCTEYYDLENHINHDEALAFYMDYAIDAKGLILEPMCGAGRFLIPMLQAGLQAQGFDASIYMINAFKQNYSKVSDVDAPIWQSFIEDFNNDNLYKLIFIPYGSWGLLTDQATVKKSLEIIFKHLAVGGKFVLEIETIASVPKLLGILHKKTVKRADGSKIRLSMVAHYEPVAQIFESDCKYESIIDNEVVGVEFEEFKQYLYKFDEFDQMLRDVGFKKILKFQDFKKSVPKSINAYIIIYECSK